MKRLLFGALLLLPREAHAHSTCVEQSDVVGDRLCSRYGDRWSSERTFPLVLGIGMWSGHVVPANRNWSGTIGKNNPERLKVAGDGLGIRSIDDVGFDLRFHGFINKHFYTGIDWAMSFGNVHPRIAPQQDFVFEEKRSLNWVHARIAGVVGGRLPLGPFSARLEALVGLQVASVSVLASKNGGDPLNGSFTSVAFLLEPRLAVDVWTSPWSTITAWGGASVFFPADRTMGLSIALHGRAFDGRL